MAYRAFGETVARAAIAVGAAVLSVGPLSVHSASRAETSQDRVCVFSAGLPHQETGPFSHSGDTDAFRVQDIAFRVDAVP